MTWAWTVNSVVFVFPESFPCSFSWNPARKAGLKHLFCIFEVDDFLPSLNQQWGRKKEGPQSTSSALKSQNKAMLGSQMMASYCLPHT
jgi:hypothetical protein